MSKAGVTASTGLAVAGGLLLGATPAAAQIELGLAGYMEQWVGYGHSEQDQFSGFDVQSDTEVHFVGETALDNGLQFGVELSLNGNTDEDQVVESFLYVESGLGRAEIGDRDSAASLMHYAAPDVGIGINDGDVANWVNNPTAGDADSAFESTYLYLGEDKATKLTYFTPRIAGFQVGASYIPEFEQDNSAQPEDDLYHDGLALGVNFVDSLGEVEVAASATYLRATAPDGVAGVDDARGYAFGLNLGYAGFTLGGSYADTEGSAAGGSDPATSLDGEGWDVGLAYETGPLAVSFSYYHGSVEGDVATPGDDENDTFMLSGAYLLGPGIAAVGSVYHVDYDGDTTSNDGYAAVGGFVLEF